MTPDVATIRKLLFTPCTTKEQLRNWVTFFLNIDLPDCIVSEHSNSSPFHFLWEIYDRCLRNDLEEFSRIMSYASRNSGKTLGASIFEVVSMFHLQRNVIHMAAALDQSRKALEYVKSFLNKPYIKDFVIGDNAKENKVVWYLNKKGDKFLTEKEFTDLVVPESERLLFERREKYVRLIAATVKAANSQHSNIFLADEVDVIEDENAYKEAKNIPSSEGERLPLTILTSTRKYSFGLVQKEIEEAHDSGLEVRHWNVIDVTKPCLPDRHRPEKPRVELYINEEDIKAQSMTEQEFEMLDTKTQSKMVKIEAFAGCVKCPLLPVCKTKLATHQKSTSKILRPITEVISSFKSQDLKMVQTQLMCFKPDESGLIYPKFSRDLHAKSAAEMYEIITGDPAPANFDKLSLVNYFINNDFKFITGMDFGFTHAFAVTSFATDGYRAYVFDAFSSTEMDLEECIELCQKIKKYDPIIFGDIAYPAYIKAFRKHGFRAKDWKKYPGSVAGGIEVVRMKLKPAVGTPQMFFLKDDPGVESLMSCISKYHFKIDQFQRTSDIPDDTDDDYADSLRYGVMNFFSPAGNLKIQRLGTPKEEIKRQNQESVTDSTLLTADNYLSKLIDEYSDRSSTDSSESEAKPKKKGRFFYDI